MAPGRVPLQGFRWNALLRRDEVARLLGMKVESVAGIPASRLPRRTARHDISRHYEYRAADVTAYMFSVRTPDLWMIDRRDGTKQKFSESLFVVFPQLHP